MKASHLLLGWLLAGVSTATAEDKSLSQLFPSVTGIQASLVDLSTAGSYGQFDTCRKSLPADYGTKCDDTRGARFFRFIGTPTSLEQPFALANRCVAIRPRHEGKQDRGFVTFTGAGQVRCSPAPGTVEVAQLVVCYERAVAGAFCSVATACFTGEGARGRCTRDYAGEEIFVGRP